MPHGDEANAAIRCLQPDEPQSGISTVIYVVALFGSVLLHELGHTLVARRYGIGTVEIVMYPIGGVSRPERPPKVREELWIALAGPLVNLFIAVALLGWVAARNEIGFEAILLYTIQFIWQFPHFWSIAWILDDESLPGYRNVVVVGPVDHEVIRPAARSVHNI